MTVNETTNTETTNTETGYAISRLLDARVDQVWAVWTTPNHFARWFNADPASVSLDVRPGGRWSCTIRLPDGSEQGLSGEYAEVDPPHRLVETMDGPDGEASMTIDLEDLGGRTRITITQECATAEERDMARQGSEFLVNALASYVTEM